MQIRFFFWTCIISEKSVILPEDLRLFIEHGLVLFWKASLFFLYWFVLHISWSHSDQLHLIVKKLYSIIAESEFSLGRREKQILCVYWTSTLFPSQLHVCYCVLHFLICSLSFSVAKEEFPLSVSLLIHGDNVYPVHYLGCLLIMESSQSPW